LKGTLFPGAIQRMICILRVTFRLHSSYMYTFSMGTIHLGTQLRAIGDFIPGQHSGACFELLRLRRALVSTSSHRSFFYPSRELSSLLSRGQFYIPPTEVLSEQKLFKQANS